jgi:hypothetical protein
MTGIITLRKYRGRPFDGNDDYSHGKHGTRLSDHYDYALLGSDIMDVRLGDLAREHPKDFECPVHSQLISLRSVVVSLSSVPFSHLRREIKMACDEADKMTLC